MESFVEQYESVIRLSAFLGIFLIMAVWEIIAPKRQLTQSKVARWTSNIGLVVVNTLVLRLFFPAAAVGFALYAQTNDLGYFNHAALPGPLEIIVAIIVLDSVIYFQHVLFHAVPVFWRLHRVHHADLDFDVTTGARFHPIEIILSMLIKFAVIILLGPAVSAVVIFEVVLNATAMFNHSNVRMPALLDKWIRYLIVTPDMHRVHHSIYPHETNSNFGFNLSLWDRLFGTYRAVPDDGHEGMTIGIETFRDRQHCVNLPGMLSIPFLGKKATDYAVNRQRSSDR